MTQGTTSPGADPRLDGLKLHSDLTKLDRAIARLAAVTRLHAAEHGGHKATKETSAVLESWSVANGLLTEAMAAVEQARKHVMAVAVAAVTVICRAEDRAWKEEEEAKRKPA